MKLHSTTIDHLIRLFEMHGGHRNEQRLRSMLGELDLAKYDRQDGKTIVVLQEELDAQTQQAAGG